MKLRTPHSRITTKKDIKLHRLAINNNVKIKAQENLYQKSVNLLHVVELLLPLD